MANCALAIGIWLAFASLAIAAQPHVVLMVGEDEYDTATTLSQFASAELEPRGLRMTKAFASDADPNDFRNLEALDSADLVVLSVRRRTPKSEQLARLRKYLDAGKPLVAIRTSSHAFVLRDRKQPPDGCSQWPEFDREVLGGNYHDHHNNKLPSDPKTYVWAERSAQAHPILAGVPRGEINVRSWLYKVQPLATSARVLMMGRVEGRLPHEPVAWTNEHHGGRVFYTSLGHQDDFEQPAFRRMLTNGIFWALKRSAPPLVPDVSKGKRQAQSGSHSEEPAGPVPGTRLLTLQGDIASELVDAVDRFLLAETRESEARREQHWRRDFSSPDAYARSIEPQRKRLAHIIGARDERVKKPRIEFVATTDQPALVARAEGYDVFRVRWPAFADVAGEGLLLVPKGQIVADVVALPDADVNPEQIVGLAPGTAIESQYARRLAESGCRVLVPTLIDRGIHTHKLPEGTTSVPLTNREFVYRPAYELGRHLIGYEVQKILAGVDCFAEDAAAAGTAQRKIGVAGWGEGGLLALHAAALDQRIDVALVSGYFADRRNTWQEPADRNIFGLLEQFGDAELATMVFPRTLVVEAARAPEVSVPGNGGAPGRLPTPTGDDVVREAQRAVTLVNADSRLAHLHVTANGEGRGRFIQKQSLDKFLTALAPGTDLAKSGVTPRWIGKPVDATERLARQVHEIDRHSQALLAESPYVREQFMKKLDTSSIEKYTTSVAQYRRRFYDDVIGRFPYELLPPNARSRKSYEGRGWTGYEVTLDVFPGLFAYGILLVPNDIKRGERRPVVVCQHGLEGRPQHTIGEESFVYYKAFAAKLAERGFVTFAPQNLYIFEDRFRTLQRKANPLGKTVFSIIVPQHQQITDWLKTLPYVDGQRIGFYGLSYGGKTAMRVPALVDNYCLSICSGDFNDWVWKNASTRSPYSYTLSAEYEIFEFDLGSTFNYAEMAALIAPRPFMVERGHFDKVAPDEAVAYEFAKVRFLYEARLGLKGRAEIEWFVGPHTINGQGTFKFLHRHLKWPERGEQQTEGSRHNSKAEY